MIYTVNSLADSEYNENWEVVEFKDENNKHYTLFIGKKEYMDRLLFGAGIGLGGEIIKDRKLINHLYTLWRLTK